MIRDEPKFGDCRVTLVIKIIITNIATLEF